MKYDTEKAVTLVMRPLFEWRKLREIDAKLYTKDLKDLLAIDPKRAAVVNVFIDLI